VRDCAGGRGGAAAPRAAMRQMQQRAAYHRVLKLSRTIADPRADAIQPAHIAEAIQYRPRRME